MVLDLQQKTMALDAEKNVLILEASFLFSAELSRRKETRVPPPDESDSGSTPAADTLADSRPSSTDTEDAPVRDASTGSPP